MSFCRRVRDLSRNQATEERRGRIVAGKARRKRPGCSQDPPSEDGVPEASGSLMPAMPKRMVPWRRATKQRLTPHRRAYLGHKECPPHLQH
jgi:hypothetical protein